MKRIKGKQVWGSTRYFINIDLYTNVFSPSMSGLVSFYDTRGLIAEKDCRNLHELVRAVYEFWTTILPPHQTRVARWLEEYFTEMGIPSDYRLILRLIKTEEIAERPLEDLIEPSTEVDSSSYLEPMKIREDSNLRVLVTKLKQQIEDEFEITDIIQKVIEKNSLKLPNVIKRTYQFQLGAEDVIHETEFNIEIGSKIGEYKVVTRFENIYGAEITNIKIVDLLPFSYKIEDIVKSKERDYAIKRQKNGIEVVWTFDKLENNGVIAIEYHLSKRIKRTVLEIIGNEMYMIESFNDIEPHGLDFGAELYYSNIHANPVEYLFIFDEIPAEYKIIRTDPDAIPPIGMIEKPKMRGTIIRWKHKNIKPGDNLNKMYLMDYYPYVIRSVIKIRTKEGKELLKSLKLLKIMTGEQGYKIMYVIKALSNIEGVITLTDKIPQTDVIVNKEPAESQVLVDETGSKHKNITWVIDAPKENKYKKLLLYVTGSVTPLVGHMSIQLENIGDMAKVERVTSIKRELIPEAIEDKIKTI